MMIAKLHALPSDLPNLFFGSVRFGWIWIFLRLLEQSVMKSYNCAEIIGDYRITKITIFRLRDCALACSTLFFSAGGCFMQVLLTELSETK